MAFFSRLTGPWYSTLVVKLSDSLDMCTSTTCHSHTRVCGAYLLPSVLSGFILHQFEQVLYSSLQMGCLGLPRLLHWKNLEE